VRTLLGGRSGRGRSLRGGGDGEGEEGRGQDEAGSSVHFEKSPGSEFVGVLVH
jgi:hypothetical protein